MLNRLFGRKAAQGSASVPPAGILDELAAVAADTVGGGRSKVDRLYCLAAYSGHLSQQVAILLTEKEGRPAGPPEFNIVRTTDGSHYLFGDGIHRLLLAESPLGPYWQIGRSIDPPLDLEHYKALAGRSARTVGGAEFGVPEVAAAYRPSIGIDEAALKFSGIFPPLLARREIPVQQWPSVLGQACAAEIGRLVRDEGLDRRVAAGIAAEALVCGSHVYKPSAGEAVR